MRPRNILTVASLLLAAAALVGCSAAGRSDAADKSAAPVTAGTTAAAARNADATEQSAGETISGDLILVDLQNHTFTLRSDSGVDHLFAFSDATSVVGASSTQGLAGLEGARVTVHFERNPSADAGPTAATKIDLQ